MKRTYTRGQDGPAISFNQGAERVEFWPYNAGESVVIFKGATGCFGAMRGSKSAGIVVVTDGGNGIHACDFDINGDVSRANIWDVIQSVIR